MNSLVTILIYLASFVASSALLYAGYKKGAKMIHFCLFDKTIAVNLFIVFAVLIVMLLGFVRYGVGNDYVAYLETYQYHADGTVLNNNENYAKSIEYSYWLLAKLSYWLTNSPILFFGVPWLATVYLSYLGLRFWGDKFTPERLALAWFTILSIITPLGFNQIRQTLAVAIFFYASKYLLDNSKKGTIMYAVLALVAFLCHQSSIIVTVPMLFVAKYMLTKKSNQRFKGASLKALAIGVLSIVAVIIILLIFRNFFEDFSEYKYIREFYRLLLFNGNPVSLDIRADNLIIFAILVPPMVALMRFKRHLTDRTRLLYTGVVAGVILSTLSLFVMNGERLSQYFILFAAALFFMLVPKKQLAMASYPLAIFLLVALFGWQSSNQYNTVFYTGNVDLNAISNKGVRSPYSQLLCVSGLRECDSVQYESLPTDKDVHIYSRGDLWGFN